MRREAATADIIQESEVARAVQAVQHAIDVLAAALQGHQQQKQKQPAAGAAAEEEEKKKKEPPAEPLQQLSEVEQQIAKAADGPTKPRRSRGGFRGRPPPPTFDFDLLPDSTLLTETEAAAVGRWSTNTLSSWRELPDHPLKWIKVGGGRVRYRAGDVRQFLASGYRVQPGLPPIGKVAMTGAERVRRYRLKHGNTPKKANAAPAPEIAQDAPPAPRRRAVRPRAAGGLTVAPADDTGVAHG